MGNLLKTTKTEEQNFKFDKKNIFLMKEQKKDRNIYHTKILKDIYKVVNDKKHRCMVFFKKLLNESEIQKLYLYPIQEGDKFLGIFYGYRKPIRNILVHYELDGVKKAYTFSKTYYIEFRFKTGSVFCYLRGLFRLLKKEKMDTPYNKALVNKFLNLEKHVYKFYNKKYSDEGLIIKWILKNLKQ
ncbi:hypothetical protein HNR35_001154 [Borreliella spielmanii]|uniref:Plasmid partitioning associated protein-1 n=1 Tax=Borreliella spielmanii TaxID=88916 RepID=A0ABR6P7Z8_9SPIR|nr:hypothetical protein [Borreliella spielmanii]